MKRIVRRLVPKRLRQWLWERHLTAWPPVRFVRFGQLRRTRPISSRFGYDRGLPIDRYYIERFLAEHAADVRGVALEFQDADYLRRYGGDAVTSVDVMNLEPDYPGTTIVGDLATAPDLPDGRFDCIICTGVIQLVSDVDAAVRNLHRMLRPGGVALVTLPAITRIARDESGGWEDQWRLTSSAARRVFSGVFGPENAQVQWYGNVLPAVAFLMGLATEELKPAELDARDPDYEFVVAVRATRA